MNEIFLHGLGAVSPAGWGVGALREALAQGEPLATKDLARPGWSKPLRVRQVPPLTTRPAFVTHARLRRASPISQYAVAAALEALGENPGDTSRVGVIFCVMSGCINYSKRFYDEAWRNPATASPLVFPETVFNAPSSHLAALLGSTARNYTFVGDQGAFLHGLALAADWLLAGVVDGCLVVGAEELDWLGADAFHHFTRELIPSEGAGALLLTTKAQSGNLKAETPVQLAGVTDAQTFSQTQSIAVAAQKMRAELPASAADLLLCDGRQNLPRFDAAETAAWRDWSGARLSPKQMLGEGSAAASAWQCVAAVDALRANRYPAAVVSVVGSNQQAIGAHFTA
ncbi:MAG: hypothetical protein RL380_1320 [Verrucomicrobiota bacterium]|jgi:3-oxoacyl-(acyl-carrier-protein) synthase